MGCTGKNKGKKKKGGKEYPGLWEESVKLAKEGEAGKGDEAIYGTAWKIYRNKVQVHHGVNVGELTKAMFYSLEKARMLQKAMKSNKDILNKALFWHAAPDLIKDIEKHEKLLSNLNLWEINDELSLFIDAINPKSADEESVKKLCGYLDNEMEDRIVKDQSAYTRENALKWVKASLELRKKVSELLLQRWLDFKKANPNADILAKAIPSDRVGYILLAKAGPGGDKYREELHPRGPKGEWADKAGTGKVNKNKFAVVRYDKDITSPSWDKNEFEIVSRNLNQEEAESKLKKIKKNKKYNYAVQHIGHIEKGKL